MRPNWKPFANTAFETTSIDWASEKQKAAFHYGPAPLCCSGGFGAAKTYALCLKALYISDLYPNNRGVIARKVAKELSLTTQSTFFKICPPAAYDSQFGGRRADSENYLRLAHSGSEILWLHLEDQDIDKVIRGLEINWFILDQAEEISEEIFETLLTRLGRWDQAVVPDEVVAARRSTGQDWPWLNPVSGAPMAPTYPMIACNPDAETHWIYKRFHKDSIDWKETYSKLDYRMISMPSYENKFLPKQNLEEMMRKDKTWVRRFVHAEWGIPEGQIHDVKDESVIQGTRAIVDFLKVRCRLHRTLDHGDASPTCCAWWAVDRDGNCYCYREYYKPNLLVSEHRKNISRMSRFNGIEEKYTSNLADPSMFYKTMQKYGGRWSFSDDYEDRNPKHGFDPTDALHWQPADNSEMGTRNLIGEYLRLQGTGEIHRGTEPRQFGKMTIEPGQEIPRVHPITGEYGYWPRLFFIAKSDELPDGCYQSIRQTRSQRRVRIGTDLGKPIFSDERDEKVPDHAYDVLRYFLSSRASVPATAVAKYGKNTFFGQRDELKKWEKRGGMRRLRQQAEKGALARYGS
jgi:hypothetical protein